MSNTYHIPVLLPESIEALRIVPNGVYADVTFGGGGHSRAILAQLNEHGRLYAFDQDEDAQANIPQDPRFRLIPENFSHLKKYLRLQGVTQLDGIIADLGVSWHQFDTPERGFSIRYDEQNLDMRMNRSDDDLETAADILNTYKENDLVQIFQNYGELPASKRLAASIVTARRTGGIKTVAQLKFLAEPFMPKMGGHQYLAQLFQALRIAVNKEMEALEALLSQSALLLRPEARLVVIAYHSSEDRIVKNYLKKGTFDGSDNKDFYGKSLQALKTVGSKPIVPNPTELKENPKSRSAKMRIGEKIALT